MVSRHNGRDANDDDKTLLITSKTSVPIIAEIIGEGDDLCLPNNTETPNEALFCTI